MKRGKECVICWVSVVRAAETLADFNPVFPQQEAVQDAQVSFVSTVIRTEYIPQKKRRPIRVQSSDCDRPVWFLSGSAEQYVHSREDPGLQSLCFKEHFTAMSLTHQSWFCTWQIPDILPGAVICSLATPCGHQAYVKTLSQKPPSLRSKETAAVWPTHLA